MPTYVAVTPEGNVEIDYPGTWTVTNPAVANLKIPRQLFAASNRVVPSQVDPERSQPAVAKLPTDAVLLWCYYQMPGDPPLTDDRDVPDYSAWHMPFDYATAQTFPAYDARGWDPLVWTWRRIGTQINTIWLTVHIFEGRDLAGADLETAKGVLSSVRVG